ncbi:MAG TPA: sigma-70 family RNA polymerase sigma factor, partial [Polyangiaceae bacterium]|nr:sigma-70 family RNA polymerase sigma factor [Polyangiaceae bacterium]
DFSLVLGGPPAESARAVEKPEVQARALVNDHFDFVWRLLRRLGVPEADVDDAAQQVFIVATRRMTDIALGRERTFLYGTALRIAATLRRNLRRRERFIESVSAETEGSAPTPHDELERRRALSFLDTVLQALDDNERVVFVLCEIEELSAPEVASLVGIPIGTVASRLRRARQAFVAELTRLKAKGS